MTKIIQKRFIMFRFGYKDLKCCTNVSCIKEKNIFLQHVKSIR